MWNTINQNFPVNLNRGWNSSVGWTVGCLGWTLVEWEMSRWCPVVPLITCLQDTIDHTNSALHVSSCCGINQEIKRGIWVADLINICRHEQKGWHLAEEIFKSFLIETRQINLRDLIAATGLAILLKLDSNRWFFACVTLTFDGWPRKIYYIKLWVWFQIHQWIQTGVKVRKHPIWVKIDDFFSRVNLQFDVWPWKTIGHLFLST